MANTAAGRCRCRIAQQIDAHKTEIEIGEDFDYRMKFNFKRFIYLFPSPALHDLDKAIRLAMECEGYEAHRIVYCKDKASHVHIRYSTEGNARKAVENFLKHRCYKEGEVYETAGQVYDLLRALYVAERQCKLLPSWTLAIVDINGLVEHTNPLAKDVLQSLLQRFGTPYIFYHKEYRNINHVQVLFSSMAEALGASIAHGYWYNGYEPESMRFHYRIRLVSSEKETTLLQHTCTFKPEHGAYDLDYFVGAEDCSAESSSRDANPSRSFYVNEPMRGIENDSGKAHRREFVRSNRRSNKPFRGRNSSKNQRYAESGYDSRFRPPTFAGSGQMVLRQEVEHEVQMDFMHVPN